jgi:hypothetical protein
MNNNHNNNNNNKSQVYISHMKRHFQLSLFLVGLATDDADFLSAAAPLAGDERGGGGARQRSKKVKARVEDADTAALANGVCRSPTLSSFLRHDFLLYARAARLFTRQLLSPTLWGAVALRTTRLLLSDRFAKVAAGVVAWDAQSSEPRIVDPLLAAVDALAGETLAAAAARTAAKGGGGGGGDGTPVEPTAAAAATAEAAEAAADEAVAELLFRHTCEDLGPRECVCVVCRRRHNPVVAPRALCHTLSRCLHVRSVGRVIIVCICVVPGVPQWSPVVF